MVYNGDMQMSDFLTFLKKNKCKMKSSSSKELTQLTLLAKNKILPNDYMLFMQHAGNGIDFFRGSSFCINEVYQLNEWALELLQENKSLEILDDNDFVFLMHQGYLFYFFKLNEGLNPPIYYYEEGKTSRKFVKKYNSLIDFLVTYYNEIESFRK